MMYYKIIMKHYRIRNAKPLSKLKEAHHQYTKCSFLSSKVEVNSEKKQMFPNIFNPIKITENTILPNRIIMGSMHSGLEGNSMPKLLKSFLSSNKEEDNLEAMAHYLKERAQGGVSLVVTGGISPNHAGAVGPFGSKLSTRDEMLKHKVVTETLNDYNTKICLQILHAGRYAMHPFCVAPSSIKSPISAFKPKALSIRDIQATIDDYVNCALLAKEAGYHGIELMGSEGYLIHQFLVTHTNERNDQYGGNFMNRMRFPIDLVRKIKNSVADEDFIIIFRLSMIDLLNSQQGLSWEEVCLLAQMLEDAGVHVINTGIGWHESRIPTIATCVPRAGWSWVTEKLKEEKLVQIPLVATNRFNDPHRIEQVLAEGHADMVSMARPFLADAEFVDKIRLGHTNEINTCIACNQACLDHVFVGKVASCLVNPRACHEKELPIPQKIAARKKIAVVGAGPAGLSFSVTAAQFGHHVILFDKATDIGGQFNMAKKVPGKEDFYDTLRYFDKMLTKHSVRRCLGQEVTSKDLLHQGFDRVVIATGVVPRIPYNIPGIDHEKVVSYIDVLKGNVQIGKKVAIIGAGGIGFDVAEYLLHTSSMNDANDVTLDKFRNEWNIDSFLNERGGLMIGSKKSSSTSPKREIFLLQRKKGKVGANLGKTTGWIHRTSLKKGQVKMISGCSYEKIDELGHLHITNEKNNTSQVLEVDNVVICAGQISLKDLELELLQNEQMKDYVYTIGGAYQAGELDAKRAINMGTRLAYKLSQEQEFTREMKIVPCNNVGSEERMMQLLKKLM